MESFASNKYSLFPAEPHTQFSFFKKAGTALKVEIDDIHRLHMEAEQKVARIDLLLKEATQLVSSVRRMQRK